MVGSGGGKGVRPFCEVWCKEGAGESKVEDAVAPNEGHGKPSKHTRGVEEGEAQIRRPIKVRGRGGDLIFLEGTEGVSRGVVNIQVTQGECGKGGGGEDNVWRDRAGVVGATLGAVRVDYREGCGGGVEETIGGEKVEGHNISPPKKPWKEGNSRQKGTINVKSNPRLTATGRRGGKNSIQIKRGEFAPIDRRVLQGDNTRGVGQLRKRPEQRKEHIPAPEAVVLNECEGFRRGVRGLLAPPGGLVVLH